MQDNWGRRLTKLIKDNGKPMRVISKDTNIPMSTLHSWTTGTAPTDYLAVRRLAQYLGTSFCYLLSGEHESEFEMKPELLFHEPKIILNGYAKIRIEQLIPKQQLNKSNKKGS